MSDETVAIRAAGLAKQYQIYPSPRDILLERITGRQRHVVFEALRDFDLTVKRGQVMGIMGPNGAGKSTLLKLITGTVRPTGGTVEVNGRVSAILELGTGFTPHNTGRENIRMGCLCLGMSMEEIRAKEEQIIAFSELEEFIDRPFGTYSSGMQGRLTFAVAISPNPDVLIVDEALAVGDARFQQKCFGRIRAMREGGTTILLVSHDDNTISSFCDEAIIMQRGCKVAEGPAGEMAVKYHRMLFGKDEEAKSQATETSTVVADAEAESEAGPVADTEAGPAVDTGASEGVLEDASTGEGDLAVSQTFAASSSVDAPKGRQIYGDGAAELVSCAILDADGHSVDMLISGQRYRLAFEVEAKRDLEACSFGFAIRDRRATAVWGMTNRSLNQESVQLSCGERLQSSVDVSMWLAEGEFSLVVGVANDLTGEKYVHADPGLHFSVKGPSGAFTTAVVNLDASFDHRVKSIEAMEA